jgi:hypothetical protein
MTGFEDLTTSTSAFVRSWSSGCSPVGPPVDCDLAIERAGKILVEWPRFLDTWQRVVLGGEGVNGKCIWMLSSPIIRTATDMENRGLSARVGDVMRRFFCSLFSRAPSENLKLHVNACRHSTAPQHGYRCKSCEPVLLQYLSPCHTQRRSSS